MRATWRMWGVALLAGAFVLLPAAAHAQSPAAAARKIAQDAQRIDEAATRADATDVEENIAREFSNVTVKLTQSDPPHRFSVNDVQALRDRGLGFGEITIIVALYANRPGSRFSSLDRVLALREAVQGWGQVAKAMGYDSLGAVQRDVKRGERAVEAAAKAEPREPASPETAPRAESVEKTEDPDKDKLERPEKPARSERVDRPEKHNR